MGAPGEEMPSFLLNTALENEKEIQAFAQQQLVDLAPHLQGETPLELTLSQSKEGFEASLVAEHFEGQVQTVGKSPDIFNAIINAKEGLLEYCLEMEAELNPRQRHQRIEQILRRQSRWLH